MEINKIYHGNCMDVIKTFPDKSIDCVITSPPYWQLRDYKWNGQWGLEPTFQLYLEHLWSLMDEVYRVLKDTGTVWINLGDTYNGNKRGNNDPKLNGAIKENSKVLKLKGSEPDKCLLLIPHRFAIGCIDRGWIIRNDIIWAKRNGMPESVTDRFSKKKEYIFFMAKEDGYYFDIDGIRDKLKNPISVRNKASEVYGRGSGSEQFSKGFRVGGDEEKGRNPGDVSDFWDINTKPNKDEHFASYNTKLIDKPIMSGCPKGGIILDPFCGTATTGCRAIDLQRKFIGIEGKEEYVKIGNKKLLPFQITQQLF